MKSFHLILVVTLRWASISRTEMTRQEFRNQFKADEFVFDIENVSSRSRGAGGTTQIADVSSMKVLSGEGISANLFTIEPCGINLPHTNPGGTELIYLIVGDFLRTAFVEENGGRTIVNDIRNGQVTIFPKGLVHLQLNLDCQPAKFIAFLNHEDPGVLTLSTRMFEMPIEVLSATFDMPFNEITKLKEKLPITIAKGREECLSRCKVLREKCRS